MSDKSMNFEVKVTYFDDTHWVENEVVLLNNDISLSKEHYNSWRTRRDVFRFVILFVTLLMSYCHCSAEEIECPACQTILHLEMQEKGWFDDEDTDWTCDNPYCDNRDKRSRDRACSDCDKYKNERYYRNRADRHKHRSSKRK